jgi:hypothetical protein
MLPVLPRSHLTRLGSRLWPARRYSELREGGLEGQLAALVADVQAMRAEMQTMREQLGQLGQLTDEHRRTQLTVIERQDEARAALAELRTRLRRTQGLTARTYEAVHDWPAALAAARAEPVYERAYQEVQPLVSIPIPTYNRAQLLCERTLPSVQAQTYTNWEAIVVGDHCTDDTEERVAALGDPRITFHNLPVREVDPADPWERWAVKGSIPRGKGIEMARGTWIAPLSDDDTWDPDHLEALLETARRDRAEVAYSRMRVRVEKSTEGPSAPGSSGSSGAAPAAVGAWPPQLGQFAWQASVFNGALRFLRYDRVCALASEPNDWNLARRAWEAGALFRFLERETATLWVHPWSREAEEALAARGLPPEAAAFP